MAHEGTQKPLWAPLDGVGVQPDVTVRRDDAADGCGGDDVQLNVARAVALTLSAGG